MLTKILKNGQEVNPRVATLKEIIEVLNLHIKRNGNEFLEVDEYYPLTFSKEIQSAYRSYKAVENEKSYLYEDGKHPALIALDKLYKLVTPVVAEHNDEVVKIKKRVVKREANNKKALDAIAKAKEAFLYSLADIELAYYENDNIECTVSGQKELKLDDLTLDSGWYNSVRSKILEKKVS